MVATVDNTDIGFSVSYPEIENQKGLVVHNLGPVSGFDRMMFCLWGRPDPGFTEESIDCLITNSGVSVDD